MASKDMKALIDEYLSDADWRIKENSNVGFSIGGMILHAAGAVTANKWLNDIYPKHIADAHKNASIHIHDLSMLGGYCAGWSLRQLLTEGLGGVADKITSQPASHLSTACNQIVNFLGTMQNEWAGAQALSSFDTYLAPFIKWEGLTDKEVRQCLQSFLFGVNTPSRWGCVPVDTEVLTTSGWKKYNEVQIGDEIATFNMATKGLEFNVVEHITIKPNEGGILHEYRSKDYSQQVTSDHRVLTYAHNSSDPVIRKSEEIFSTKTPYSLPIRFFEGNKGTCALSDAEIQMAAFLYADGNFDFRGDSIHKVLWYKSGKRRGQIEFEKCCTAMGLEFSQKMLVSPFSTSVKKYAFYGDSARKLVDLCGGKQTVNPIFYTMSERQAKLFLNTWMRCDGDTSKFAIQYDCDDIADALQFIAILAGYTTYKTSRKTKQGVDVNYIKLRKPYKRIPSARSIVKYDGLVWCPTVKNGTAVFRRNQSVFISGQCQAPFTNVTFDLVCPDDMKGQPVVIGGEFKDFTYGDCQEEMNRLNSIYLDILEKGDASGRGFQYPIPTYNITEETQWDSPVMQKVFGMAAKYGTPYFQNFLGSGRNPRDVRSMCCRLSLSLKELRKRGGGLFGSDEFTGSLGVVTINLPQIAYLARGDKNDFFARLKYLMDISKESLEIKRKTVQHYYDMGLYPYTKRYLRHYNNHFNTIGICGMNEACINLFGYDITSTEGKEFAESVLDYMRDTMQTYQEETGNLYNLEATPAESTSYRLAKHDKKNFPDIITSGDSDPFYTNSSQLPVDFTTDIFDALDHQESLQMKYTGGTVFHAMLGEKITDWRVCRELVQTICSSYRIPYFTISPVYSICAEHGYLSGEHKVCPECGAECEVYARIVGYYRSVKNWNAGKVEEYKHRLNFVVDKN
jgi:ribonucleoside-triphosphate reductase